MFSHANKQTNYVYTDIFLYIILVKLAKVRSARYSSFHLKFHNVLILSGMEYKTTKEDKCRRRADIKKSRSTVKLPYTCIRIFRISSVASEITPNIQTN